MTDTIQQHVELRGDDDAARIFEQMSAAARKAFDTITKGADNVNRALSRFSQEASGIGAAAQTIVTRTASIEQSFRAIENGAERSANALRAAQRQGVTTSSIFYNLSSALKSFDLSSFSRGFSAVGTALDGVRQSVSRVGQAFDFLGPQARRAATAIAAVFATREIVQRADTYTTLQSRLKLVTNSEEERVALEKRLYDIAKKTQSSLEETINLYVKLSTSVENSSTSIAKFISATPGQKDTRFAEQYLSVVEQINKALKISGATTQEANASIRQLGQAMAKGKLDGDEFRTVMEAFPALATYITKGLGITKKALYELARAGALTPQQIIKALRTQTREIDADFARISPTISSMLQIVGDAFTRFIGTLDTALGGSSAAKDFFASIVSAIDSFTEKLAKGEFKQEIQTVIAILRDIGTTASLIGSAFSGLGAIFTATASALTALLGISVTPFAVFVGVITVLSAVLAPIPVAIAAIVLAIGYFAQAVANAGGVTAVLAKGWENAVTFIKTQALELWDYIVNAWNATIFGKIINAVVQFFIDGFNRITELATQAWNYITNTAVAAWDKITGAIGRAINVAREFFGLKSGGPATGGIPGLAGGGGPLRGPGTTRSDSILARLSRGEFVMRAAAVRRYGADLFAALNEMRLDPSALVGSLAPAAAPALVPLPRFAEGGAVSGRPLTLNIGGQSIGGLTATPAAVQQLERYAIKQSLTRAGRKPTWYR